MSLKSFSYQKDNNLSLIVGCLSDKNVLKYEDNGRLNEIKLSGKVYNTKFNDVFVFGEFFGETMSVLEMESLPHKKEKIIFIEQKNGEKFIRFLIVPKDRVKTISPQKSKENSTPYNELKIQDNDKSYLHIKVYQEFTQNIRTESYVFALISNIECQENTYGKNFAQKKVISKYANGYQIKS